MHACRWQLNIQVDSLFVAVLLHDCDRSLIDSLHLWSLSSRAFLDQWSCWPVAALPGVGCYLKWMNEYSNWLLNPQMLKSKIAWMWRKCPFFSMKLIAKRNGISVLFSWFAAQMEATLETFLVPKSPISRQLQDAYRDHVTHLTRRFFYLLLR